MAKTLKLTTMSTKYLVDFLSMTGWTKDHKDVYRAGQLLCEALPVFLDAPTAALKSKVVDPLAAGDKIIAMPPTPGPVERMPNGEVQQGELIRLRTEQAQYNRDFVQWCRQPAPEVMISDQQSLTISNCLKYFSEKGQLPPNEYSYRLLSAFGLNPD